MVCEVVISIVLYLLKSMETEVAYNPLYRIVFITPIAGNRQNQALEILWMNGSFIRILSSVFYGSVINSSGN